MSSWYHSPTQPETQGQSWYRPKGEATRPLTLPSTVSQWDKTKPGTIVKFKRKDAAKDDSWVRGIFIKYGVYDQRMSDNTVKRFWGIRVERLIADGELKEVVLDRGLYRVHPVGD